MENLADVHKWLIDNHWRRVPGETHWYAYEGVLECDRVQVPVCLRFRNLDFIDIPKIILRSPRPEELQKPLPHIDTNGQLCVLDTEKYVLDQYRPVVAIVTLLDSARRVLNDCIAGRNSTDTGAEFMAYWNFEQIGAILSRPSPGNHNCNSYQKMAYTDSQGENRNMLLVGTPKQISDYATWRHGTLSASSTALWVQLGHPPLLPPSGSWPPQHPKALYQWLDATDRNAALRLKKGLETRAAAHLFCAIRRAAD